MGRVQDRIAIVTGAAKGMGREICLTLAGEGAHVVVAARDEAEAGRDAGGGLPDDLDQFVAPLRLHRRVSDAGRRDAGAVAVEDG